MTADHDPYWDELALGHVLGGLDESDGSAFRRHLVDCGVCRTRVGELRAMASEMAIAEREERAVSRIRMAAPRRAEEDSEGPVEVSRWPLVAASIVVVLALITLVAWTAQLRASNDEMARVNDLQERTLDVLGHGTTIPLDSAALGVTGVVAVDGDRLAYSLGGLPALDIGERLVVWVEDAGGVRSAAVHTPSQLQSARLASTIIAPQATRLLMTIEGVTPSADPGDDVVIDVELT